MGIPTQHLSRRLSVGGFANYMNLPAFTVASVLAASSALAVAGVTPAAAMTPPSPQASSGRSLDAGGFADASAGLTNDALSFDPTVRHTLLTQSGIERPSADVEAAVVSAGVPTTAPRTEPLLIPLPDALSTGVLGLIGVAAFGGARRLRRRLLA